LFACKPFKKNCLTASLLKKGLTENTAKSKTTRRHDHKPFKKGLTATLLKKGLTENPDDVQI